MNVSKIKLRIRRNSKARPLRKLTWLDVRLCLFVFFCQTFYKHWRRRWLASWQAGWLCDWLWFLSSSLLLLSLIVGHLLFHNIYSSVSQSAVPFSHDSWFIGFFKFLRANKLPSVFLLLKLLENIHSLLDRSFSSVSQACSSPSVLKCRNYYWPKDIGHEMLRKLCSEKSHWSYTPVIIYCIVISCAARFNLKSKLRFTRGFFYFFAAAVLCILTHFLRNCRLTCLTESHRKGWMCKW